MRVKLRAVSPCSQSLKNRTSPLGDSLKPPLSPPRYIYSYPFA